MVGGFLLKKGMLKLGEATTFSGPFWFGEEGKVTIIVSNSDYILINYDSKKVTNLGKILIEAKEKLKDMGKEKNFPDFMSEKN